MVITSVDDQRFEWLKKLSEWLEAWKQYSNTNSTGFLTKETYTALQHTVTTLVALYKELLQHYKLKYILTGKFQTDNIESRFGLYRMLSVCNYLVSVVEVLQNEKKLRMKNLLKLYSSSKGTIPIKDFLMEFGEPSNSDCDNNFIASFPHNTVTVKVDEENLPPLLYTTGYVAKKMIDKLSYNECKMLFGNKSQPLDLELNREHQQYIQCLDRGGLMYPSNILLMIMQCSYSIFNMCISAGLEVNFLRVINQRQTLLGVIEKYLTANDDFIGIYHVCEVCDETFLVHLMKALKCFINVLLNNYTKNSTDKLGSMKQSRKVSKLK